MGGDKVAAPGEAGVGGGPPAYRLWASTDFYRELRYNVEGGRGLVVVLFGLPRSGKSSVIAKLREDLEGKYLVAHWVLAPRRAAVSGVAGATRWVAVRVGLEGAPQEVELAGDPEDAFLRWIEKLHADAERAGGGVRHIVEVRTTDLLELLGERDLRRLQVELKRLIGRIRSFSVVQQMAIKDGDAHRILEANIGELFDRDAAQWLVETKHYEELKGLILDYSRIKTPQIAVCFPETAVALLEELKERLEEAKQKRGRGEQGLEDALSDYVVFLRNKVEAWVNIEGALMGEAIRRLFEYGTPSYHTELVLNLLFRVRWLDFVQNVLGIFGVQGGLASATIAIIASIMSGEGEQANIGGLIRVIQAWGGLTRGFIKEGDARLEEPREALALLYDSISGQGNATRQLMDRLAGAYGRDAQSVQNRLDSLNRSYVELLGEIERVKREVAHLMHVYTPSELVGVEEQGGVEVYYLKDELDRKGDRIVGTTGYEELAEQIAGRLRMGETVVLVGPHGLGKSTLARYTLGAKAIDLGFILDLSSVERTDKNIGSYVKEFKEKYGGGVILYDPSTTETYSGPPGPWRETQLAPFQADIEARIRQIIYYHKEIRIPVLIVLPQDIWEERVGDDLKEELGHGLVDLTSLSDTDLLRHIVSHYAAGCSVEDGLVEAIKSTGSGALIAKYVGLWLRDNGCRVGHVWATLDKVKNMPLEFIKHYIKGVKLKNSRDLYGRAALSILVRAALGELDEELLAELPTLVGHSRLEHDMALFLSKSHEDLVEEALWSLMLPGLRTWAKGGPSKDPFTSSICWAMGKIEELIVDTYGGEGTIYEKLNKSERKAWIDVEKLVELGKANLNALDVLKASLNTPTETQNVVRMQLAGVLCLLLLPYVLANLRLSKENIWRLVRLVSNIYFSGGAPLESKEAPEPAHLFLKNNRPNTLTLYLFLGPFEQVRTPFLGLFRLDGLAGEACTRIKEIDRSTRPSAPMIHDLFTQLLVIALSRAVDDECFLKALVWASGISTLITRPYQRRFFLGVSRAITGKLEPWLFSGGGNDVEKARALAAYAAAHLSITHEVAEDEADLFLRLLRGVREKSGGDWTTLLKDLEALTKLGSKGYADEDLSAELAAVDAALKNAHQTFKTGFARSILALWVLESLDQRTFSPEGLNRAIMECDSLLTKVDSLTEDEWFEAQQLLSFKVLPYAELHLEREHLKALIYSFKSHFLTTKAAQTKVESVKDLQEKAKLYGEAAEAAEAAWQAEPIKHKGAVLSLIGKLYTGQRASFCRYLLGEEPDCTSWAELWEKAKQAEFEPHYVALDPFFLCTVSFSTDSEEIAQTLNDMVSRLDPVNSRMLTIYAVLLFRLWGDQLKLPAKLEKSVLDTMQNVAAARLPSYIQQENLENTLKTLGEPTAHTEPTHDAQALNRVKQMLLADRTVPNHHSFAQRVLDSSKSMGELLATHIFLNRHPESLALAAWFLHSGAYEQALDTCLYVKGWLFDADLKMHAELYGELAGAIKRLIDLEANPPIDPAERDKRKKLEKETAIRVAIKIALLSTV